MARKRKVATLQKGQEPDRPVTLEDRPDKVKELYKIMQEGFELPAQIGKDRDKAEAIEVKEAEPEKSAAEEEKIEEQPEKVEQLKEPEVEPEVEPEEVKEELPPAEEVEPEVEPEVPEEVLEADYVELSNGVRIPVDDLEVMAKTFVDKEGKALPISQVVEVFNAGLDPTVFLRKGNEVRQGLTKEITAKDARISALERQLDTLTQELIEAKRARVLKPDVTLLDTNPAAYNAQLLEWIDAKGAAEGKAAELASRRKQTEERVKADVDAAWAAWHNDAGNVEFLNGLTPTEREQFEANVIGQLQESYQRTGLLLPLAVPMQYTIGRLMWERQTKTDDLTRASLSGAKAEQRKRLRIIKSSKTQIAHGAVTARTVKPERAVNRVVSMAKLQKAISAGDQDAVNAILKEAHFGT